MNESVTKLCKICQIKVEENIMFHFFNNKLLDSLPEVDPHLTQDPVICNQCFTDKHEFKQLEANINKHIPLDNNFKEPDANFIEVLVKEEPGVEKIKEEFDVNLVKDEVCDSQIIKEDFLVDINNEKPIEMYCCYDCGHCTDTRQNLVEHIFKRHRKKDLMRTATFHCDKCDYKCRCRKSLKEHTLSQHLGEKPYQCDKCDYKCVRRNSLKMHKFSHTNKKQYRCTECKYGCNRITYLKKHMIKHTGAYPFQCDKCDYKCVYKSILKKHELSQHAGEKSYQCDKCDYKCIYKSILRNHTLSRHDGKKPYHCDKCDYKSSYKSHLQTHTLSKHTGEKPYQCDKCKYRSSRRDHLSRHKLSHTNKKSHK